MLTIVQRVLGLTPRELGRAAPLFTYLFLTMAGSVASKAARDALFLDRFRAIDLPYVDIAIAVLVGLVAGVYIRAGGRTNLRNLQIGSLVAFAASAVLFWWLARAGVGRTSGWLFIVIYVWVGVLSVLAPSQVWTLANYMMTTREAKRAFGFIGGGAILGWIVGGLATRVAVTRFGTESTLLWVAATLLSAGAMVWLIWSDRPDHRTGESSAAGEREGGLLASFAHVRGSRYLSAIALLICLAAVVTTIAGWQFKAIAKANIPDTDALATFFGTFNIAAGLVALVIQLLITGRVLKSLGVGVALFIVPAALALSSAGVLIVGSLMAAAALKASDQVLRYSIDKATVELLYLPVPAWVTFRVKSFIDTVVYRLGDAIGGVTVLVFAAVAGLTAVQMTWICLVLIGGWLWAAVVARRQYVENLRDSIHQHRVDTERASAPLIERSASNLIASRLNGEPGEILYALGLFEMSHDRAIHPAVRGLLHHESADVRQRAVHLLARAGDRTVSPEIERLLYDEHLEVRTEALLYLAEHTHIDPLERIEQLGNFPDFSIRAAMVAFLSRPGPAQNMDAARVLLATMVDEIGATGRRTRLEAARLIGALPDMFDRELRRLLDDPDHEVTGAAIRAVGRLRKRAFVGRVIERLAEPSLTEEAAATLAGFGDGIVGTLRDTLVGSGVPIDIRREIPGILQMIGTLASQYALMESILEGDTVLRHRIITALNKIGQLNPQLRPDRRMLETVLAAEIMGHYRSYQVLGTLGTPLDDPADPVAHGLRASMEQEAERIFRLLKILYPGLDLHSAYVGLESDDPTVHDNAMEFLEAILTPELRSLVVPLFDRQISASERARIGGRLLGAPLGDREEAISVMMLSRDPWLQACAAYAIGEFRLTRFESALEEWTTHPDPLLRATARGAMEKLRASSSHHGNRDRAV